MNNATRKQIEDLIYRLEGIKDEMNELSNQEHEKFDNLPEGIQLSATGEAIQAAADCLDDGIDYVFDVIEALGEAIG